MVIEPGIPDWARRAFLAIGLEFAPLVPRNPVRLPVYATADLPNPAKFPNSVAIDSTLGQIVYSDGSAWI